MGTCVYEVFAVQRYKDFCIGGDGDPRRIHAYELESDRKWSKGGQDNRTS